MSQLKKYSTLTDEVLDLGPVDEGVDLLELGSFVAEGHDNAIVFIEGKMPPLKKWKPEEKGASALELLSYAIFVLPMMWVFGYVMWTMFLKPLIIGHF